MAGYKKVNPRRPGLKKAPAFRPVKATKVKGAGPHPSASAYAHANPNAKFKRGANPPSHPTGAGKGTTKSSAHPRGRIGTAITGRPTNVGIPGGETASRRFISTGQTSRPRAGQSNKTGYGIANRVAGRPIAGAGTSKGTSQIAGPALRDANSIRPNLHPGPGMRGSPTTTAPKGDRIAGVVRKRSAAPSVPHAPRIEGGESRQTRAIRNGSNPGSFKTVRGGSAGVEAPHPRSGKTIQAPVMGPPTPARIGGGGMMGGRRMGIPGGEVASRQFIPGARSAAGSSGKLPGSRSLGAGKPGVSLSGAKRRIKTY